MAKRDLLRSHDKTKISKEEEKFSSEYIHVEGYTKHANLCVGSHTLAAIGRSVKHARSALRSALETQQNGDPANKEGPYDPSLLAAARRRKRPIGMRDKEHIKQ